jgi:acetyltransferase-like isoleucine patch superfamily enzyme
LNLRSAYLTSFVTEKDSNAQVCVTDPFLPVTIKMGKGASFVLKGKLTFDSWAGSRQRVHIELGAGSNLTIAGDFILGNGCRIVVIEGGQLHIGGRLKESGSGITEKSMILVRRRVTIGTDLICSWGVFITDCDWHETTGTCSTEDTVIGDHVWITPNCSILKGSRIGNGCIVTTGAVTHKASYDDRCLLGGIPARVLDQGREWTRDLKPLAYGSSN